MGRAKGWVGQDPAQGCGEGRGFLGLAVLPGAPASAQPPVLWPHTPLPCLGSLPCQPGTLGTQRGPLLSRGLPLPSPLHRGAHQPG